MDLSQYSQPPQRTSRHGRDPDTQLLLKSHREKDGCTCWRQHCNCHLWCKVAVVVAAILAATIALLVILLRPTTNTTPPNNDQTNEQILLSAMDPSRMDVHLRKLTSVAHMAGTPANFQAALYVQSVMATAGLETQILQYDVLLSTPRERSLSLLIDHNVTFRANLTEPPIDPDSALPSVPTFLAYSASGDITAPLVYVNYGTTSDWAWIVEQGINTSGCIALVRYGKIFRGNKVSIAASYGAIGVIIYSDPADDGYGQGAVYPDGPWRPEYGVQRGSIWNGNGDPLTPGIPSIPGAPRITLEQAQHDPLLTYGTPLPSIPALPISWGDALPLFTAIDHHRTSSCQDAPHDWRGALDVSYCVGKVETVTVRLNVQMDMNITTISNVIGKIQGEIEPDRIILLGNHRDAWTFGAVDPSSGTAALLGMIESYGKLLKTGWKPRRSIWFASWDAEEYALTGSTEFVEQYETLLSNRVVVYINVDQAVAGHPMLGIQGMTSLKNLVYDVTKQIRAPAYHVGPIIPSNNKNGVSVEDVGVLPSTSITLFDLWSLDQGTLLPTLTPAGMGTGSDYGPFMQHLGIPSLNLEFHDKNRSSNGIYHSQYDTYYWITRFGDDKNDAFQYHIAMGSLWSILAIRLADSTILPLTYSDYAKVFANAAIALPSVTHFNATRFDKVMSALNASIDHLLDVTSVLDTKLANPTFINNVISDPLKLRILNDRLMMAERMLLYQQGIPGREWYRHICWVASEYDMYGASAFGWIHDSLYMKDMNEAERAIGLSSVVIRAMADFLDPIGFEF